MRLIALGIGLTSPASREQGLCCFVCQPPFPAEELRSRIFLSTPSALGHGPESLYREGLLPLYLEHSPRIVDGAQSLDLLGQHRREAIPLPKRCSVTASTVVHLLPIPPHIEARSIIAIAPNKEAIFISIPRTLVAVRYI